MECIKATNGKKGKTKWCALKLVRAKAFDSLEWNYLMVVLKGLGFSSEWCAIVY